MDNSISPRDNDLLFAVVEGKIDRGSFQRITSNGTADQFAVEQGDQDEGPRRMGLGDSWMGSEVERVEDCPLVPVQLGERSL